MPKHFLSAGIRQVLVAPLSGVALGVLHILSGRAQYGLGIALSGLIALVGFYAGFKLYQLIDERPSLNRALVVVATTFFLGLGVIGVASGVSRAHSWVDSRNTRTFLTLQDARNAVYDLYRNRTIEGIAERTWLSSIDTRSLYLEIIGQLAVKQHPGRWSPSEDSVSLEHLPDSLQVAMEKSQDYVTLGAIAGGEVGGRTFRATVTTAGANISEEPQTPRWGTMWFMTWGNTVESGGATHFPLVSHATTTQVIWTPSSGNRETTLRLMLRVEGEVRILSTRIEELVDGAWVAPVSLAVTYDDVTHHFSITDWDGGVREHHINIGTPSPKERIVARLGIPTGYALTHSRTSLLDVASGASSSLPGPPRFQRQQFWWGHPTLAGHILAVVALSFLIIVQPRVSRYVRIVFLLISGYAVWLTGSSAALIALTAIGGVLSIMNRVDNRQPYGRNLKFRTVFLMVGGFLIGLGSFLVGGTNAIAQDLANRIDTWRSMAHCFYPIGLWKASICSELQGNHAHNIVLQALSTGGLLGLALTISFVVGIALLLRNSRAGASLFAAVIALQVFDFTFFHAGVLAPMALASGFAFAHGARHRPRRRHVLPGP